jgi:hypothetical protein
MCSRIADIVLAGGELPPETQRKARFGCKITAAPVSVPLVTPVSTRTYFKLHTL